MFCIKCGKELKDGAVFCTNCGERVRSAEPVNPAAKYVQPEAGEPTVSVRSAAPYRQSQVADQEVPHVQPGAPKNMAPYRPSPAPKREDQYVQPEVPRPEPRYVQPEVPRPEPRYVQPEVPRQDPRYAQPAAQYGQAAAPAYVKTPSADPGAKKKREDIWPGACGTMGVLALVFYLTGLAILKWVVGFNISTGVILTTVIAFILMAVLFFVHTRQLPWVTIFPFLIYLILSIYSNRTVFDELGYILRSLTARTYLMVSIVIFPIVIFIFYLLIVLIRPENNALRIIFLIMMILQLISLFIYMIVNAVQMIDFGDTEYMLYIILMHTSRMFFYIGYLVAGMNVRRAK